MEARGSFLLGGMLPSTAKPKKLKNGGFKYTFFEGNWDKMPDFKKLKPVQTGIADTLLSFKNLPAKNNFACLFEGYVEIPEDGYYIFTTITRNASRLYWR
jgi:hypothetical protein